MSSYDSSSEGSQDEQKDDNYFQVFQHDYYLSASLDLIEDWNKNAKTALNDNNSVEPLKYLELEKYIFDKQENHLRAAYHIRYYSFTVYLKKALNDLVDKYQALYKQQPFSPTKIKALDQQATKLSFYLEKLQLSRAVSYVEQINDQLVREIYDSMEQFFPYINDPYCIWRMVMFLEIMNEDKGTHVMNIPFNMTLQYYLKTFKTLKFKHHQLTKIAANINPELEKADYFNAYISATTQICKFNSKENLGDAQEKQAISDLLVCEFLSCLRYMDFATNQKFSTHNNLYLEYIFSSLKVPFYGKNQNMPSEYYEKLFLRILTQLKEQPKLIDLALYIDPNIVGQRSQQSFGKLQEVVLNLCRDVSSAQQTFLANKSQPQKPYLKELLKDEQYTLLIQFLQTIMAFNKSAFLKADQQIYQIFLDMAEFLKNAFLSFGKDLWLFPQNIFSPLTLNFFKKISQDINDDLKNILYQMVENLNADKLPQKLVYSNGKFDIVNVTRLEYLSAIMYYVEDCSREEEYLNLPEIAPANFETSVLLIKSLHVKLKHHEPNPTQMPLFIEYLKECEKYKLHINFIWFKQENYLAKSFERQTEFQIEAGLPSKEIQSHFRKCLNYRDREFARKLITEDYNQEHLINAAELAAMLKYNHGIENIPTVNNVTEEEIFILIQEMQTMLAIIPNDLFDLPLAEEINVNYLHLLLTFYCTKIQSAKGSDIYFMILQKILLNYLKSPIEKSRQFRKKYPTFFQKFIYQFHQIEICGTLNEFLIEFQEKYMPFSEDEKQWPLEQKNAVADLKEKITEIRTQFLDKLEGQEEQIAAFLVTFTSIVSEAFPFTIFLECVRLFVKLILRKISLQSLVSVDVFLCQQTYSKPKFFQKMLNYFENSSSEDDEKTTGIKGCILQHLIKSPDILGIVKFKELMELFKFCQKYISNGNSAEEEYLQKVYKSMKNVVDTNPDIIRPEWILAYILLSRYGQEGQGAFDMFDEEPLKKKQENQIRMKNLLEVLKKFESNHEFWTQVRANLKDFKFKQFDFLFEFTYDFKDLMKVSQDPPSFESIWLYFLKQLNDPSWTFYYMLRLKDPSLINIHENRDEMLINLIKKEKLTKESYPIFKSMISDTKDMPYILAKIMQSYENEENYVDNFQFHNKLILINERFPDPKVEECILRWIQVGQNKLPLKIPQNYYINFIKKRLKSLSQNLGFESILKVHHNPDDLNKLNKEIEKIFEILLYFPIKKFQSVSLTKLTGEKDALKEEKSDEKLEDEENMQDEGDWQEEQENDDIEIKKTEGKKNEENKNQDQNQESDNEQDWNQLEDEQQGQANGSNNSEEDNYYDDNRPDILEIFFEEDKKDLLQSYKHFCKLREQIDTYLKSDYQKLTKSPVQDNEYLVTKLLSLMKELGNFQTSIQDSILTFMPDPLYQALQKLGYSQEKPTEKIQKLRKPQTKIFRLRQELFSERGESDGSQSNQENDYSSQDYEDQDSNHYDQDNSDSDQMDEDENQVKIEKKKKHLDESEDDDIELPELGTQFSKIESEIKGHELDRRELIKILEVFLIQIFKLTPINFKKNQIVFSYLEIMESDLGQVFFESVLTLLRMDENPKKHRKNLLEEMKQQLKKKESKFQLQEVSGFPEFSKYNGVMNFTHLLKILKEKGKYPSDDTNPFRKESGAILPIAQKFIIEFDLPIQTNVFSLVLLYIGSKNKIQELIEEISISYESDEMKLTKKQVKRINEAFLRHKTQSYAWEFIESTVNYQVKDTDRLIISLDSYSREVFKALASSGLRVKETIEKNNELFNKKASSEQQMKPHTLTHIKHYQRLYYITSNLLSSCSQEIKQFYFMNKQICRYLWEDDDQNEDNYNYKKVPKKLQKCKEEIYTNQEFVHLLELAFRIIYFVKKELYGKISSKKFARLIHYPKLIIQTATLYMHLSGQKGTKENWDFLPKNQILKVIDECQMGEKKWKNLTQVYNLILGLLQIETFSNGKFKELLIPYFTKNKKIGLEAPLMFKVPEIDTDNVQGQNIFITRECSFDMALYQVNGPGLFVEFKDEEGSDHGGLIREFMMGWKGVGVGEEHFFIGKILGISFRQSVPYGGYVDLEMCIKITNYKITLQNLQEIDKDIYNSLKYIKENDPQGLGLTFSVMKKNPRSFEPQEYNLKPNGNEIEVKQDNKEEYIQLYLEKYYEAGREYQLAQTAAGFYTVVCQSYASIFKPHELMQHIKGQEVCDINVLKSHVKYTEGYTETSVIIKWLWEILETYNQQQLNKFIQFLTGSPKLPIFNPNFEITFQRVFEVKNLPVAHTCFNTLDLPEYPTKDILEKNLLTAIFEGNDNFSIM